MSLEQLDAFLAFARNSSDLQARLYAHDLPTVAASAALFCLELAPGTDALQRATQS